MSSYRRRGSEDMDILYLLLPIIGAFVLLFLVCCFGKKVKEMLHIPKELVLGRHFAAMAPSNFSSRSSLSDFSNYGEDRQNDDNNNHNNNSDDDGEIMVVRVDDEHERVINQHGRRSRQHRLNHHHNHRHHHQHHHHHHRYAHVPSTEIFSFHQNPSSDNIPSNLDNQGALPLAKVHCSDAIKAEQKRSDSCPLVSEIKKLANPLDNKSSMLGYIFPPFKNQPSYLQCQGNLEQDSDNDIPGAVLSTVQRQRHRSNSDSDVLRCLQNDGLNAQQRLSQLPHKLSSTEIQLHAEKGAGSNNLGNSVSSDHQLGYHADVG